MRSFLFALLAVSVSLAHAEPALDFPAETFSFSNDTVFSYGTDEAGNFTMSRKDKPPEFSHRCFILARSTLQFHKFARFEPTTAPASEDAYRRLVRSLSRIPVWAKERAPEDRIVFPGYANLHEFSRGRQGLLKQELGNWFATYLRVGNWRIVWPIPRSGQARLSRWLTQRLDDGRPAALFLARFPKMNHVVIPFDYHREPGGDILFTLYDPNYPGERSWLRYVAAEKSFELQKRWYFPGGRVNALRVYISPFH